MHGESTRVYVYVSECVCVGGVRVLLRCGDGDRVYQYS